MQRVPLEGLQEEAPSLGAAGEDELRGLRHGLDGDLVLPGDRDYDRARQVWNGAIDKRPAAIAYCTNVDDVIRAVAFGRQSGCRLAVRSGGHNIAGLSVEDGALVIDLSRMKRIDVDPRCRIARAEAGLLLGEFDRATQAHGLATTMGVNSDTGISGLTLGGGFGKLGRKFGLACDNLVAAEVVTADGTLLRASEEEHADLFWGLRGGGGNFGIVTAFEYRLHPVGPELLVASATYGAGAITEAMHFYDDFARNAPDEICADAALVTAPSGERLFSISACYVGRLEEGAAALAPLANFGAPLEQRTAAIPYLQIQSNGDALFPRGRRYYWKAQFLREISANAIAAIIAAYQEAPVPTPVMPMPLIVFQQVGGAIARVPIDATAYVNRDAAFDCFPLAIWDDPHDDAKQAAWARDVWRAVRPFSTGGVYANNLGDEGDDRVRDAYGVNYARLVEIKNRYDPDNLFRLNQNIRPTASSR